MLLPPGACLGVYPSGAAGVDVRSTINGIGGLGKYFGAASISGAADCNMALYRNAIVNGLKHGQSVN